MITYLEFIFKVEIKDNMGVKSALIEADNNFYAFELSKISALAFSIENGTEPYQKLTVNADGILYEFRHRNEKGFIPGVKVGFQKLFNAKFGAGPR